jgi:hypothetical protein
MEKYESKFAIQKYLMLPNSTDGMDYSLNE